MKENEINKQIEIDAPVSRVWEALTNHKQFSAWFRVNLESPFAEGETAQGYLAYPGYEHLRLEAVVQTIEPEHYFSFTWHPYAVEEGVDYSKETPTLVEFRLEPAGVGTLIRVRESGFENLPPHRFEEAMRMNTGGWKRKWRISTGMSARIPDISAAIFAALGDETRLQLIVRLSGGEAQSITQLKIGFDLTRQAVTKHLVVLEEAGLVQNRKSGRERIYRFNPEPLDEMREYLDYVSRQWDDSLLRLKNFVENN